MALHVFFLLTARYALKNDGPLLLQANPKVSVNSGIP